MLARTLFQVLRESFLVIRASFRPPIATLLGRLYYFGQLNGELLLMGLRTIDSFDLSE